jgi:uncharacterized membrane protein
MEESGFLKDFALWFWRWTHVVAGVAWIGHLWFFNFVNANLQKELSADVKKAVNPGLMLRALFLFRWGAMLTYISGWVMLLQLGYMQRWGALAEGGFSDAGALWILLGMLFGTVMWFNVWFIIWPAQKKIIGGLQGGPAADPALAPRAALASKVNTYLSVPLLLGMVSSHNYAVFGGGLLGLGLGVAFCLGCVWLAYKFAPKISTKLIEG